MTTPQASAPVALDAPELPLRRSLQLIMLAWVFGAAWFYMSTGAVLTRLAQLLGFSEFEFGLLAAIPFIAVLAQIPTVYLLERYGGRRLFFLIGATVHRAVWVVIAGVPWIFPEAIWPQGLLLLVALSAVCANISGPPWMAWMADLVPRQIRGRYFGRRAQVGQFVGIAVTFVVGYALDRAGLISPLALKLMISAILVVASLVGITDILLFLWVPDATRQRPDQHVNLWGLYRVPLANRNFRRFLWFSTSITFSAGLLGQFIWLYIFDVAGKTNMQANLMLVISPLLVCMLSYAAWGRLVDRLGRKPVLILAGIMVVFGSSAWILVTRDTWVLGFAIAMVCTVGWPGIDMATFNILLGMAESARGRRQGSAYIVVHGVITSVAGAVSGILGGTIAACLGKDWLVLLCGWPLTYHGVLFLLASAFRVFALFGLIRFEDRRAYSTRMAIQYVVGHLYSSVQQSVIMPFQIIGRVGRLTYKLDFGRKRGSTSGRKTGKDFDAGSK